MSTRVCVARSNRNTPPNGTFATPHTTSSVRSAVRARSSPRPVATMTACSASSSRLRRLSRAPPARPGLSLRSPSPRLRTDATPTAAAPAARSDTAHQNQSRRLSPRCSRADTSAQSRSPASPSGRANQGSPRIITRPARSALAQPSRGVSGSVEPRARSPEIMTSAVRAGRLAIAPASDSKRRPTTTMPAVIGAIPST